jgi:V/A-type H+-transporting ATPase subunit C
LSQSTQYASVLAKIGAERSTLLGEVKLKALTESKDLSAFTSQLRETSYQLQISKLSLSLSSRKLERAFNENFIESVEKIAKNSPEKVANYLNLYLLRFEVENIKVLVKATNANLSPEQKIAKLYLSVENYLKHFNFEDAAKASNVKQLLNSIKITIYASCLNLGLQSYEETGSTAYIDVLLDKVYYEKLYEGYMSLPKKERSRAHFYASTENDGFTLLTLLRGKNLNYDANWLRRALPQNNFNLSMSTVDELLSASDFESALKIVLESNYASFFVKAQSPEEVLSKAEKAFKKSVLQYAKSNRIVDSFNIGGALAFITQKESEVHDLIATSAGIEAAVSPEKIQGQLLL